MGYIIIILNSLFTLLFFLTAIDKMIHFKHHEGVVQNYNLIQPLLIRPMLLLFILCELYLTVIFLIHWMPILNIAVFLALLGTYTSAVAINILRGNVNINCGCGSILENDQLTYGIIVRNVMMLIVGGFLFYISRSVNINISLYTRVCLGFFSVGMILAFAAFKQYSDQMKFFKRNITKIN